MKLRVQIVAIDNGPPGLLNKAMSDLLKGEISAREAIQQHRELLQWACDDLFERSTGPVIHSTEITGILKPWGVRDPRRYEGMGKMLHDDEDDEFLYGPMPKPPTWLFFLILAALILLVAGGFAGWWP